VVQITCERSEQKNELLYADVYKFRGPLSGPLSSPESLASPTSWMIRPCKYFSVMAWI